MAKRNLMVSDLGGSVVVVSDTLHEKDGDYVKIATIKKGSGDISWSIDKGLDAINENSNNHPNFEGTVQDVVERWAVIESE
ncbi:hypothetical protein ACWOE8_21845 [Enterococcus avium]